MVTLQRAIQFLHPDAEPLRDYTVTKDRNGERVTQWSEAALGPQPTPEQLDQVAASAEFLAWLDALPRTVKLRKVLDSLEADDVETLRQRAILKLIMSVFIETRTAINTLTSELSDAGLPVTKTKLTNRSWAQLERALATFAEVEAAQAHPNTHTEVNP